MRRVAAIPREVTGPRVVVVTGPRVVVVTGPRVLRHRVHLRLAGVVRRRVVMVLPARLLPEAMVPLAPRPEATVLPGVARPATARLVAATLRPVARRRSAVASHRRRTNPVHRHPVVARASRRARRPPSVGRP